MVSRRVTTQTSLVSCQERNYFSRPYHIGVVPVTRAGVDRDVVLVIAVVVDDARHGRP